MQGCSIQHEWVAPIWPPARRPHSTLCAALSCAALLVSGCAVVGVAATAATLAVGVVSTAVDVGVGAVKVTGKVIGKTIDVATGSGSPAPAAPSGSTASNASNASNASSAARSTAN